MCLIDRSIYSCPANFRSRPIQAPEGAARPRAQSRIHNSEPPRRTPSDKAHDSIKKKKKTTKNKCQYFIGSVRCVFVSGPFTLAPPFSDHAQSRLRWAKPDRE